MRLFMNGDVEKSLKDFEDGLEEYFATSRRFRSTLRRGSIVLLDDGDDLFRFFTFLAERCGLEVGVVHVREASSARKAVEDIGDLNVKAVVIDSAMLGESLNGDSLSSWLSKAYPRIPVWVVNCEAETRRRIRSETTKIGVIEETASLSTVAETIGFPDECQRFVREYAN